MLLFVPTKGFVPWVPAGARCHKRTRCQRPCPGIRTTKDIVAFCRQRGLSVHREVPDDFLASHLAFRGVGTGLASAGALLIGALALFQNRPREHVVVAIAHLALWLSVGSVCAGTAMWLSQGRQPVDLQLLDIYRSGDYALELRLYFDLASVVVSTVAAVLILATSRFAQRYLHREPGFVRFFVLMLTFAVGCCCWFWAEVTTCSWRAGRSWAGPRCCWWVSSKSAKVRCERRCGCW